MKRTADHISASIDPEAMLEQARAWSLINTGTGNLAGLSHQASVLAEAFASLPGEIELHQPAPVSTIDTDGREVEKAHGRHLVVRVRPEAERRLLLTGHMDTVFPADHPFQHQTWIDDETLCGPGLADMKGGIAVILHALLAFEASESAGRIGYDVMINSDEETGSLSSSALIDRLARGKYAALTYEPSALPDGTLAHARGGSGNYSLVVSGRAAHAGRNPREGRNAIVAAADFAVRVKALGHEALSVNPARIDGGSANNVVPDHAVVRFNIRPRTSEAAESFQQYLNDLIGEVAKRHEVTLSLHGGITRPPKPVDGRAQKLFDLVQACGAELGQQFGWQSSGGVCDGNNIAACGVPVVDTMGVRGGSIHSSDEYLVVPSLAERASLSALVLTRLASGDLT
ncbi:acetylornithine deacetylase [Tsuneonella deserti]|uniref:Acetylornithine deacetylase n=1 Tax=Tsuneonella deserti TaxID=2035528 RepID=A0ABQ1S534_9SPHN|nr:hydrolase [Tsuneonella deserti]GGD90735.1 acetylornithine deacetylase [Tsuneonella deserti]